MTKFYGVVCSVLLFAAGYAFALGLSPNGNALHFQSPDGKRTVLVDFDQERQTFRTFYKPSPEAMAVLLDAQSPGRKVVWSGDSSMAFTNDHYDSNTDNCSLFRVEGDSLVAARNIIIPDLLAIKDAHHAHYRALSFTPDNKGVYLRLYAYGHSGVQDEIFLLRVTDGKIIKRFPFDGGKKHSGNGSRAEIDNEVAPGQPKY